MGVDEQPRWPAGTHIADDGHGPGGGRWMAVGTPGVGGWLRHLGQALDRGWGNDSRSRDELLGFAHAAHYGGVPAPGATGEWLSGGETAHTSRWDLPDGRSVIQKTFHQDEDLYEDDPNSWMWDEEEPDQPDFTDEQREQVRAEVKTARIAETIGARVPPVVEDPHNPASVWMGYVDGTFASEVRGDVQPSDSAWRLGLLDLLTSNHDRTGNNNWVLAPDGTYVGIDHGQARVFYGAGPAAPQRLEDLGLPLDNPFARLYYRRIRWADSGPDVELGDLPWHPDDIDEIGRQIAGWVSPGVITPQENDYMQAVLRLLKPHAKGTRRMIQ